MKRLLAWGCGLGTSAVLAQGPPPSSDDLSVQATDPTASLMSFQFNGWSTPSDHGTDHSSNQFVFRAAIPFKMLGLPNIFRLTLPYATSSPSGQSGFGDTQVFNLTVFGAPWGRWGAGISGSVPTGHDGLSAEKWSAGPALGFVNASNQGLNFGLFAQTFFSFAGHDAAADVGVVNLQPIFSVQLGWRPYSLARQQRLRVRHDAVTLGFARARRQPRAGHQPVEPEVAAERRSRPRLPGPHRHPGTHPARGFRAAAAVALAGA
jgi:hypothetical protein